MRATSALSILAIAIVGCANPWQKQLTRSDKVEMVAALVKRDLSDPKSYLGANAKDFIFYLQIEGEDPPASLLEELSRSELQFRPGSERPEQPRNVLSWRHMRFSVTEFEPRTFGGYDVHYSFYCGSLCASANTAVLKFQRGRWVAVSSRVNWISSAPPNKALQLTANSAFQLRFGSLLAFTLGGSATFGGAVVRS